MAIDRPAILANQGGKSFILTALTATEVTGATYVARRGIDTEPGSVQRVLNRRRIAGIRDFILEGGSFPNAVILNWRKEPYPDVSNNSLSIEFSANSAQVIDGQHRIEALREAIDKDPSLGDLQVPTSIFINLGDQECADIFLAINTEQKPVPPSLVVDLFGISSRTSLDPAADRARDIAFNLNENERSPYEGMIKLPGERRRKGGIALSTAVAAIKPLVEPKGDFEQRGISELEIQSAAILNFFLALESLYGAEWDSTKNAFLFAAGFTGAMDFFRSRMLAYCQDRKDFQVKTIADSLSELTDDLILQSEVSGLQGKQAPQRIHDRLIAIFTPDHASQGPYKI
jgi:DGQHR domain-containing protein